MSVNNGPTVQEKWLDVEYSGGLYPFANSVECCVLYQQYGEEEEYYTEVVKVLISGYLPERYVDYVKERAKVQFYEEREN